MIAAKKSSNQRLVTVSRVLVRVEKKGPWTELGTTKRCLSVFSNWGLDDLDSRNQDFGFKVRFNDTRNLESRNGLI